ncbi:hypothetical protein INR49_001470 [Caranx melampygus]|nr:hypothetical protein INR49_001470 [Caranx melampygus]
MFVFVKADSQAALLILFMVWSTLGLISTPRLEVPPLIVGQPATITCTAPGRWCFGPGPKLTWIWPGVEEKDYVAVSEGRTSTLTFTPSSKHHYTDVTCKVTFTGNVATEHKRTLTVQCLYQTPATHVRMIKEGEKTTITCTAPEAPVKEKQQCAENPGYCITLLDGEITAAAGLCAEIPCSFTTASEFTHQSLVWYKCEPTTENCGDSDIIFDSKNNDNVQSEFKGQVSLLESDLSQKTCSIMINDLKESDTGSYQLRVNGVQDGKESGFTFSPRATLSVRGERAEPRLEVPPLIVGQPATITCTAPGRYCPGPGPKLTWIWPGVEGKDYVAASEGRTSTLTFTPSSKHHYIDITCKATFTGNVATEHTWTLTVQPAQVKGTTHCDYGNCITLPDGEIRAEAGLCVEIPCSFDASFGFGPEHAVWYKCEPTNENCTESDIIFDSENAYVASEFKGRVSLLESDMRIKTCTIMIKDLKESDSGSYQLRLNGKMFGKKSGYTFSPRATLSVKGLSQKPNMTIPQLVEGEETTLTCAAPGFCSGSDPKFSWRWSRAGEDFRVPDPSIKNLGRTSTLSFVPSAEQHGAEVTCKVTFPGDVVTEEKACVNVRLSQPGSTAAAAWAIAGVSLCMNVLCFILIFFLWRKKMKSNQDIRMYRSPGDDGSAQPLH